MEFLKVISSNPSNTVIGMVRNVAETEAKVSAWERPNVHIIHGDMDDYDSLKVILSTRQLFVAKKRYRKRPKIPPASPLESSIT